MKSFVVVKDPELGFMVWSKKEYDDYVKKCVAVGGTPAFEVIIDFDESPIPDNQEVSYDNLHQVLWEAGVTAGKMEHLIRDLRKYFHITKK